MLKLKNLKFLRKPFERVKTKLHNYKDPIINGSILTLAIIIITILISPGTKMPSANYRVGDIAFETIRANESFDIEDEEKTMEAIRDARKGIVSIYNYDDAMVKNALERIKAGFENMRNAYIQDIKPKEIGQDAQNAQEPSRTWLLLFKPFKEIVGVEITRGEFLDLASTQFKKTFEKKMARALSFLSNRLIVSDKNSLMTDQSKGIVLKSTNLEFPIPEQYVKDFSTILDLKESLNIIKTRSEFIFSDIRPSIKNSALSFLEKFIRPNIYLNMSLTSEKIEEIKASTKPVVIPVQKNEVIVREGDRIDKRDMIILDGMKKAVKETNLTEIRIGMAIVIALTILISFVFAKTYIRKFTPSIRDLLLLLSVAIFTIALSKVFIFLANLILAERFPSIPISIYPYAIPIAASAMLIRFAINSETAIVFSFIISLLMGFLFGENINFAIYCFITSVTGAHTVAYSETRFHLMKAAISTGIISSLAALSLEMIGGKIFAGGSTEIVIIIAMSFASGIFTALLLPTITTLVEAAGYLTDIKLVELSNFNNPLLNKLAIDAPGTYHHSRVVAQLVEVAAETIHANPLLATVSAFYHDIGKIKQPEYFIENQGTGDNKHNDLKPSMSKMIIITHVKDGIELAKEARLPKKIIDAIEQHHGTSLISFFYKKAKDMEKPEVENVDENEYRYYGPKPQTREIGLLMLADAVEAASKSITDPAPAQLQSVIQKVFNKAFTDGQLEDCEITLKDLHKIAASFFRVLVNVYKSRIDYPEISGKKKTNGDTHTKQAKEEKPKDPEAKTNHKEDITGTGS